jgi:hypothetical protein
LDLDVPNQMKAFSNIQRALLESKLAIGLFAGVFLALLIFFSASPQFRVQSLNVNGDPALPLCASAEIFRCFI